ncbi:hypothetical protein GMOD_00003018 [Pyrenophora seminiperda CCB06]|uniref:Uncharacterized protein n=1 Tax=Pyrenophora seminiperda CCB06 TaxID=1302712 RepID=A0A3M7M3R1_9PLEO|nr:hypothetical protein GMOD_00003018 [Pyrenophora seminiperda CCB06]
MAAVAPFNPRPLLQSFARYNYATTHARASQDTLASNMKLQKCYHYHCHQKLFYLFDNHLSLLIASFHLRVYVKPSKIALQSEILSEL